MTSREDVSPLKSGTTNRTRKRCLVRTLRFYVERDGKEEEIAFELRRLVNAGYTARNQDGVRKHIEELKREGIPAPDSTPTAYEVISNLVYFDREIEVVGDKTSGEAEFVLLCSGKDVFVGVGSDHTDRELETVSIIKSKQICPNVMSDRVWDLKEVGKNWDEILLRSWVKDDRGEKVLYQDAPLATMLSPQDLMEFVQGKMDDKRLDGVLIFSGTV
ncbi:MAG: DUF2848 domain-containing protein, partial [Deltaproteobacteria bacterium]